MRSSRVSEGGRDLNHTRAARKMRLRGLLLDRVGATAPNGDCTEGAKRLGPDLVEELNAGSPFAVERTVSALPPTTGLGLPVC